MKKWISSNLQTGLDGFNSYLERLQEKRAKRRFFSRMDMVFLAMVLALGILVVIVAHSPQSAQTQLPYNAQVLGQSGVANSGKMQVGRGGVTTQAAPPDCGAGQCQIDTNQATKDITNSVSLPTANDWLVNDNGSGIVFVTSPSFTVENNNIQKVESAMTGVVFGCLALITIITGYRIMGGAIGFRYADALENLSRIFFVCIAVVLSGVFAASVISFVNGLNEIIVGAVKPLNPAMHYTDIIIVPDHWVGWFGALLLVAIVGLFLWFLANLSIVITIISVLTFGAVGHDEIVAALSFGLQNLLLDARGSILSIFSIIFTLQILMRLITINLYLILGPLAIGCWALPIAGAQDVARKWAQGFLSLIFVQFVQVACLSLGILLFKTLPEWRLPLDLNVASAPNEVAKVWNNLQDFVGPIAVIWLTIRIPRMLGSSALSPMLGVGQTVAAGAQIAATLAGGRQR